MLVNGAPGSGKSTLAAALASETPMMLALDVDAIKHSLGQWEQDQGSAGLQARRLAVAMVRRHLLDGHDVVLGQYLARTGFIDELEEVARGSGATFVEVMLALRVSTLAARLAARAVIPTRPEHAVNSHLVAPGDAERLLASLASVTRQRTTVVHLDADGDLDTTLAALRTLLARDG